jgi:hypothetical protein
MAGSAPVRMSRFTVSREHLSAAATSAVVSSVVIHAGPRAGPQASRHQRAALSSFSMSLMASSPLKKCGTGYQPVKNTGKIADGTLPNGDFQRAARAYPKARVAPATSG